MVRGQPERVVLWRGSDWWQFAVHCSESVVDGTLLEVRATADVTRAQQAVLTTLVEEFTGVERVIWTEASSALWKGDVVRSGR